MECADPAELFSGVTRHTVGVVPDQIFNAKIV
jgi:hypothetical protein